MFVCRRVRLVQPKDSFCVVPPQRSLTMLRGSNENLKEPKKKKQQQQNLPKKPTQKQTSKNTKTKQNKQQQKKTKKKNNTNCQHFRHLSK